jgi:aspartyl protease family protein
VSTVYTTVHVAHPTEPDVTEMLRDVVVDTGAAFSQIPRQVLDKLGIVPHRRMQFMLADGATTENDVGHALFRLSQREEISLVIFAEAGEPPLIGAHTLESLLLGVDPVNQRLIPVLGLRY